MVCAGKDTILAVDDRKHAFSGRVEIRQTLLLHNRFGFRRHMRQEFRQHLLNKLQFLFRHRTTGIALDTTTATTSVEVAAKLFLEYIERD